MIWFIQQKLILEGEEYFAWDSDDYISYAFEIISIIIIGIYVYEDIIWHHSYMIIIHIHWNIVYFTSYTKYL